MSTLSPHELYAPLLVVDVLLTMRRPSNDTAPSLGTLLSSPQAMSTELLPATRSPRSPQPPSIPPRNPLRKRAATVWSDDDDDNRLLLPAILPLRMQIVHAQSLPLLATGKTIAVDTSEPMSVDGKALGKSLSESPIIVPLSPVDIDDGDSSTGSSPISNNPMPPPPTVSKRNHALLELLSSERAYASDLALIRDMHIPLALGE